MVFINSVSLNDMDSFEMTVVKSNPLGARVTFSNSSSDIELDSLDDEPINNKNICYHQLQSSSIQSSTRRMDITNSGLTAIPDIILQSSSTIEELVADQNQLQNLGLCALASFPGLKKLHLARNGLKTFPDSILSCMELVCLDLADNMLTSINQDISKLKQ